MSAPEVRAVDAPWRPGRMFPDGNIRGLVVGFLHECYRAGLSTYRLSIVNVSHTSEDGAYRVIFTCEDGQVSRIFDAKLIDADISALRKTNETVQCRTRQFSADISAGAFMFDIIMGVLCAVALVILMIEIACGD